jgi:hypothetical protein
MKNILFTFFVLITVSASAETLSVTYSYMAVNYMSLSGDDFNFESEIEHDGQMTIIDSHNVATQMPITSSPLHLSYHAGRDVLTMFDKSHLFSTTAKAHIIKPLFQGYMSLWPWYLDTNETSIFANIPSILNPVKAFIETYLGHKNYKIVKASEKIKGHSLILNGSDRWIGSDLYVESYIIETTNDGNLTCENCKKTDDLDKMNGNVLKITDKLAKQKEIKKENPAVITAKDDSIKKEPKKEINLNENAEHIPIGSTLTFSRNIFYQDKRIMIEISKTSNEVAMCYMTFEEVSKNNSSIPKDASFTIKRVNKLSEGDYNLVSFNFSTDESKGSGIQCLQEKDKPDMKIIDIVNSLKSFGIIIKMP